MEIRFKTKKLQKCYEQHNLAVQAFGLQVAKRYIGRINILKSAKSFEDLYKIPSLKFHALRGDREGQFALSLTGFWRLIITNDGDVFDIAKIEEVSDHYGN